MSSNPLYTQLDESHSEIRLLEILSDGLNMTLECRWEIVSLQSQPKFTALSYVWGDAKITEDLIANGMTVPVTKNLAAALRYAKSHWRAAFPDRDPAEFRLWADALCINQADLYERRTQVQLMHSLYSDAELVISWLGCGLEGIDMALEMLTTIAEETEQQHDEVDIDWLQKYPDWISGLSARMWTALSNFSELQYWKRVWIFQELLLGRHIYFCHGTRRAPHQKLFQASTWLSNLKNANQAGLLNLPEGYSDLSTLRGWFELDRIAQVRNRMQPLRILPTSDIEFLYVQLSDLVASDPRDHVYALLGYLETDIVPDYQKTMAQVYDVYIDLYVRTTHSLKFLRSAGFGRFDKTPNDSLPSWGPDFTKGAVYASSSQGSIFSAARRIFIHGWSDKGLFETFPDPPQKNGARLRTTAFLPNRIRTVHQALSELSYKDGSLYKFVHDVVVADRSNPNKSHHPLSQIFWAFVPDLLIELEHGAILQALAFLIVLLAYPQNDGTSVFEQRMAELGIPTDENFPLAFLDAFNFLDTQENIDYVNEIFNERRYLGHPHTVVLAGLWTGQVLFRFATLDNGRIALVPQYSQAEDTVAIIKGCNVPLIFRENGNHYIVVGPCFVYGLMYGEAAMMDRSETERYFKVIELE
jgi:hypothetical protein